MRLGCFDGRVAVAASLAGVAALACAIRNVMQHGPHRPPLWSLLRLSRPRVGGHGARAVRQVLLESLASGHELAAQVAAVRRGDVVASYFGSQPHITRNVSASSLILAFSTGKVVTALVVAMLVDRGRLRYSDLVIKHWPTFPRPDCTVEQLLGHDAGLAWLDALIPTLALRQPARLAALLEAQTARHPASGRGYHAITWGLLVDQLVRRVDALGRSVGEFVASEIAAPLGIADELYIGLPAAEEPRVVPLRRPSRAYAFLHIWLRQWLGMPGVPLPDMAAALRDPSSGYSLAMFHVLEEVDFSAQAYNTREFHSAIIPGSNIICSARALATVGALLAESGTLRGKTLLRRSTLDLALSPSAATAAAPDAVLVGLPLTWTKGGFFFFGRSKFECGDGWYGWGGWGGSLLIFSRKLRASYAYVTAGMRHDAMQEHRHVQMLRALCPSLIRGEEAVG